MIVLDLYTNAVRTCVYLRLHQQFELSPQSMKVKSGYSEHLQELGLVTSHLIPLVLNLLQLYGGVGKAVKLDMWSVDQFYIERKMSSILPNLNS
jgi:hypothetical protein